MQSPGRANGPLHVGMDRRRAAHAHLVGHAQPAAEFSRTAGVLTQGSAFDDDRALGFGRLHWRIVRVAVVKTYRRAHAVLIGLRAPAAARMADMGPEKAPGHGVVTM